MKKKFFALFLALALSVGLAVPAIAADSDFTIVDGILTEYNGTGGAVTIPSGVTHIDVGAFSGCSNLTNVTIPDSVVAIGQGAFDSCGSLTSVTIPNSVISIDYCAFGNCSRLVSVTIPNSVTYLDIMAFAGSSNLVDVYYSGSVEQWKQLTIGMHYEDNPLINATIHYNSVGPNTIPFPTQPTVSSFSDVPSNAWYADPVTWAVEQNITNGTSDTKFSPDQNCTQLQILTFLYRAAAKVAAPAAADQIAALKWAMEKGIIDSSFENNKDCTRATAVSYIWQAFGKPEAGKSSFTDVAEDAAYADAVSWAVENGITNGDGSETVFSPDKVCNRGQIVTFLHRAYVEEARLK